MQLYVFVIFLCEFFWLCRKCLCWNLGNCKQDKYDNASSKVRNAAKESAKKDMRLLYRLCIPAGHAWLEGALFPLVKPRE